MPSLFRIKFCPEVTVRYASKLESGATSVLVDRKELAPDVVVLVHLGDVDWNSFSLWDMEVRSQIW